MKIRAATSDIEGYGVDVDFDSASLTVQKAETMLPRLSSLRSSISMAMDVCRELITVAAPERARKQYQEARQGNKE